jgi:hypothetical protein
MHYTPNTDAAEAKRNELIELARANLGSLTDHAETLIERFASISPPLDPPVFLEMIVADRSGRGGGRSRKLGNILLNWRTLFRDSPDLILTGVGSFAQPWLIPLAALSIFNKLWAQSSIELTKEQATCLFAMWHRSDQNHMIDRDEAFSCCKELFSVYQWPEPSDASFSVIIGDLKSLGCVELRDGGKIWLREWVRSSFS